MPSRPQTARRAAVLTLFALIAARQTDARDLVWEFGGDTPLTSADGSLTISYYDPLATGWGWTATQFGSPTLLQIPQFPDSGPGSAMFFPATTPMQGYQINQGANVSQYTMIWDFLSPPEADGQWRALLQTNVATPNDGDFFIQNQPSGGVGINGIYNGTIAPNAWNRIAMTRDAAGMMRKYINGTLVGAQSAVDARFQLGPSFYLFTDEDNETQPGYVSSFRFVDGALDSEQIRLLGNVSSAGATVPGPTIPDPPPEPEPPILPAFGRTQIMGHRAGGVLAPENTIAALEVGIEAGIDLIEIDIHLTSDGQAVVFHDDTLDRTTNGSGPIANVTLAQVKQLDAGSWFSPEFAGERVPTLTEFMQAVDGRARVLLDVKVPANTALRNAVDAALTASGATLDDIWVWPNSSSYTNDPRFGTAEIQLLTSVPGNLSDANLLALKASGVDGLSVGDGSITQEAVNAFHRNDMWVDVYTVNSPARMQELIAMGVDSIETDRPDLMAELIYAGDFDGDRDVDGADLLIWQQTLGSTADDRADANDDGVVNQADLALWKSTYGAQRTALFAVTASQSPVPEPSAALLLISSCALVAAAHLRCQRSSSSSTDRGPSPSSHARASASSRR